MKRAIYPGTFDPITLGHVDVVQRGLKIFDEIYVAVASGKSKTTLFTHPERILLAKKTFSSNRNVKVIGFDGLLVNLFSRIDACAVIRGIRAVSDFDYEFQMVLVNRRLNPAVETVFLPPSENYFYISSSLVKNIGLNRGDVKMFVPKEVYEIIMEKFKDILIDEAQV
ncbi:pantetheine-phosphate adenylyltransferase [candidate division WOR-3 bacterium]|uniref:Phosphopantetheine adenylyltransferase n=1 Tax=candidate division WOR-3 bacterium TaxID=2052148 RepID=A0A660SJG4_UNCW3|nr:MAG: pantetheine-phosphate adenylyltransferase [candidate division WOR-3 bacterium]